MEIRFMWKAETSNVQGCPALYAVAEGADVIATPSDVAAGHGYIVQVKKLNDEALGHLRNLGPDETAGFVPADVLDKLRALA